MAIFAQAGIGDVSVWGLLLTAALIPLHLYRAISGNTYIGHGGVAPIFQVLILAFCAVAILIVLRSEKTPRVVKGLAIPIGFPIAMLASNILPAMFG
jgi:hypothetical protein